MAKRTMTVEVQVPVPELEPNAHYDGQIADLKRLLKSVRSENTKLKREARTLRDTVHKTKEVQDAYHKIQSLVKDLSYDWIEEDLW